MLQFLLENQSTYCYQLAESKVYIVPFFFTDSDSLTNLFTQWLYTVSSTKVYL